MVFDVGTFLVITQAANLEFMPGRTMSKELFIQALHSMHDAFSFVSWTKDILVFD